MDADKEGDRMEVAIAKDEDRCFLQIGNENIEIKDYKISSSMQGGTELEIKMKFQNNMLRFLTSATTESLRQQNLTATNDVPLQN